MDRGDKASSESVGSVPNHHSNGSASTQSDPDAETDTEPVPQTSPRHAGLGFADIVPKPQARPQPTPQTGGGVHAPMANSSKVTSIGNAANLMMVHKLRENQLKEKKHKKNGDAKPAKETGVVKTTPVGDLRDLGNLLISDENFNVNAVRDRMGHSPIKIAVRNDHLEKVEELLPRSSAASIYEALTLAISMDHDHISTTIIKHPSYTRVNEYSRVGRFNLIQENVDDIGPDDQLFSGDLTPLVIAAQRNQFEVVKLLKGHGDEIKEPHHAGCRCKLCKKALEEDELRFAKTRLNEFRALASDSYLALYSPDPLRQAFTLSDTVRKLSRQERFFKEEYLRLDAELSMFSSRILDRVRSDEELGEILKEAGPLASGFDTLGRLKAAVHSNQKKFVAHPACQKKLSSMWVGDMRFLENMSPLLFLFCLITLLIIYPFLAVTYWFWNRGKIAKFLRTPVVKFWSSGWSYIAFILMIVFMGLDQKTSMGYTISGAPSNSDVHGVWGRYQNYLTTTGGNNGTNTSRSNSSSTFILQDGYVRVFEETILIYIITIWIAGLTWQELKEFWNDGPTRAFENIYNLLDISMLVLYVGAFSLRYAQNIMVEHSLVFFKSDVTWSNLAANDSATWREADTKSYWLNADRCYWANYDIFLISEALFSVANIFNVMRLTYLLTMHERIGPLIVSLVTMIKDQTAFMMLFIVMLAAFVQGFTNLYWYYYATNVVNTSHVVPTSNTDTFGGVLRTIETAYWSIFGVINLNYDMFITYPQLTFTSQVGHVMYALYNWLMIIIMISMLIAMMSRSYDVISAAEDMEWKFLRTMLCLEHMGEGSTLCVPFNILPTWWGAYRTIRGVGRCCGKLKQCGNDGKTDSQHGSDELKPKFKRVMQKVVRRFMAHHKTGLDQQVDLESLIMTSRQDVSTFRYDVVRSLMNQDEMMKKVMERLTTVEEEIGTLVTSLEQRTSSIISTQKTKFIEVRGDLGKLDENIDVVTEAELQTQNSLERSIGMVMAVMQTNNDNMQEKMNSLTENVEQLRILQQQSLVGNMNPYSRYMSSIDVGDEDRNIVWRVRERDSSQGTTEGNNGTELTAEVGKEQIVVVHPPKRKTTGNHRGSLK